MRILVTGASGQLGSYLLDRLAERSCEIVAWTGKTTGARGAAAFRPVDLTDARALAKALADANPDLVIHAAAVSSADAARRDPRYSRAVNVDATALISNWAASHDRRLVYTSTDLVFDGSRSWYREDDPAHPTLVYGQTKHTAERFALEVPQGLVARLSLLFGLSRSARPGFFDLSMATLRAGTPQAFFTDEYRTPLDYATAAGILVRLAESSVIGTIHVGGPERLSRFELMSRAAAAIGIDPGLVKPNCRALVPLPEPRPADVSLDSSRLRHLFTDLKCPRVEKALSPAR